MLTERSQVLHSDEIQEEAKLFYVAKAPDITYLFVEFCVRSHEEPSGGLEMDYALIEAVVTSRTLCTPTYKVIKLHTGFVCFTVGVTYLNQMKK